MPIRPSPTRRPRRRARRILAVAIGAAAVLAIGGGALLAIAPWEPATSDRVAPAASAAELPSGPGFVPANLRPSLDDAEDSKSAYYADGCQNGHETVRPEGCESGDDASAPRVLLLGDSHAASWWPAFQALADDGAIRIDARTKASCPAAEIVRADSATCSEWRDAVLDLVAADPPDAIVLADYAASYVRDEADPGAAWDAAVERTLDRLPAGVPVAVLADTPDMGENPAQCLARHADSAAQCDVPRDEALDAPTRDAIARLARSGRTTTIDLVDAFCNRATCPPVIGDALVYRDSHHLSATYVPELAPVLGARLAAILP
jgi:hypothetical protein